MLFYMHTKSGIIHRDLSLKNLILNQDLNPILVDFGHGVDHDINNLSKYLGSVYYTAPEILETKVYDGR